jgi:hypothetical protein
MYNNQGTASGYGEDKVKQEGSLPVLLTKLRNAVNPTLSLVEQIENKLNGILNKSFPQETSAKDPNKNEFNTGGIVQELENEIIVCHKITERLEKINKHLSEII